jgi:ribosomal protein S12 methylthiotransferase
MLKLMRRPAATEDTLTRIRRWREICPDLTLRSTFIVGFPGETEAEFEALLEFLDEAQLDRVGCFPYSPVDGAAANALPGPVPEEVRQERWERFMEHQQRISATRLARHVGRALDVLIDRVEGSVAIGRSAADAPDIDGVVRVSGGAKLRPGTLHRVQIEASDDYDLSGRLAAKSATGA